MAKDSLWPELWAFLQVLSQRMCRVEPHLLPPLDYSFQNNDEQLTLHTDLGLVSWSSLQHLLKCEQSGTPASCGMQSYPMPSFAWKRKTWSVKLVFKTLAMAVECSFPILEFKPIVEIHTRVHLLSSVDEEFTRIAKVVLMHPNTTTQTLVDHRAH